MSKEQIENVIITLCLLAVTWLSFLSFGLPVATEDADASWTQALGYAFKHGWQAGVDYVFTFGPLGYLLQPAASYDADLFHLFVTWQMLLGLGFSLLFVLMSAQLKSRIDKFVYFFLVIVVVSGAAVAPKHLLSIMVAVILAITLLPVVTQSTARYLLFGGLLWWLAMFSLAKFSNFMLVGVGVGGLGVVAWKTQSRRLAMIILGVFTVCFIGSWLFTKQSLLNLLPFLKNSLTMASAYSDTMGGGFNSLEIKLALVILLGMTFMLISANWVKPFSLDRVMITGMVLVGLFFAWKEGFVRHDTHSMTFFTVALLSPFLIEYVRPIGGTTVIGQVTFYTLRYLVMFTALAGLFIAGGAMSYTPRTFMAKWNERIVDNYKVLTRLPTFNMNQANVVANRRQQFDLPNIRATVGQATVDIFSWEQGVVFLNGLNWHPRPVFQSYAAYTSSLLAINGDFYADSKRAPEFVIFKLQEIDGRFPFASDSEALKIILRDYQPLFSEKGYLLLQRTPQGQGRVFDGKTLLTRQINIGDPIEIHTLNKQPLLLNLDIRKSWLGHLMSFFYRLPVVYLEFGTTDGGHQSYRILPTMMPSSFVINPFISSQSDLVAWYTGNYLKKLENLKILVSPEWLQSFFQTDVVVTISESPVKPPVLADSVKQKLQGTFYPMLSSKPVQVSSPNQEMVEEGQAVLMVHAPGEMRFQVSPGKHTLTGQFGILADAYNGKCPPVGDGVEFSVVLKEEQQQEHLLFKQFLNPRAIKPDRGIQTLPGIALTVAKEATLLLLTQPGPANDAQCDWSFWRGIRID